MRFVITRTSQWEGQPCEEAQSVLASQRWDERTFANLDAWFEKFPKDFDRKILQKRNLTGRDDNVGAAMLIQENAPTTIYFVDLRDLADLIRFVSEHGHCIVSGPERKFEDAPEFDGEIEIYDDYRE